MPSLCLCFLTYEVKELGLDNEKMTHYTDVNNSSYHWSTFHSQGARQRNLNELSLQLYKEDTKHSPRVTDQEL